MVKAVYCWDSGAILTCQNLLLKSIVDKCAAPTILSNASWIHSKGYESFFVHMLSLQKSMRKCSDPSFFLTNTTALHHGDWLGQITPASSISWSDLLQNQWGYASELLLKWLTISNADLMLNCTGATKLISFQHENVMES